ncbi:MAG: SUMF1/EgtB/PvdO family nonheme iron enzyme [Candidatus Methylumidiphilus sp.]
MAELILLATAWGPKHGGINAFNTDFAKALGRLLGAGRVVCVVLDATPEDIADAASGHVRLLADESWKEPDRFTPTLARDVLALLEKHGVTPQPGTAWIGHDIHTGDVALRLAALAQAGFAVLIQHMSYRDYISYRDGIGEKAKAKADRQRALFQQAACVFAVGPLLRKRLSDLVAEQGKTAHMIVPGLADDIAPADQPPSVFRAITLGRLGPGDDRIKQGRLAVAAVASACREAHGNTLLPPALREVEMLLYGIDEAGGDEESALRKLAEDKADRVINLIALPFSRKRQILFDELRHSTVAMMLSWHEGFGLTGWEAIAAGVPLIVSRNSGLHALIEDCLGVAGLALLKTVDIKGRDDKTGDSNFHPDDEASVRTALLELAQDLGAAKKNAMALRQRLFQQPYTWANAAQCFIDDLRKGLSPIPTPAKPPSWDIAKQGLPYRGLAPLQDSRLFFGRDAQVQQVADKLAAARFVVVVGASGAGKSSLVWAGLLPKLAAGRWTWARMTPAECPGHSPLALLAEVLAAQKPGCRASQCQTALQQGETALQNLLAALRQTAGAAAADWQLLLFIDQFEELFTRVEAPQRLPFIDALEKLQASGQARIVATLRADFLGHCMDAADFGERLAAWFNAGQYLLAAPGEEALRAMVQQPAQLAGLAFDAGLAERIVADTGLKPGNLPLMAFALERLCAERQGPRMTAAAYDGFGGVDGAIATQAQAAFEAWAVDDQAEALLSDLFRELVDIDEASGAATRRRADLQLWAADGPARGLIDAFVAARLLLIDGDRDGQTLEVAHEALLRTWLGGWIDSRKDQLLMRKRLQRDAAEWRRRGEPEAFRWLDPLAVEAGAMLDALPYTPTADEARFLGPVRRADMLALLEQADTPHETRATIGVRLAIMGDDRPGVGLSADGLPAIDWCLVRGGRVVLEGNAGSFEVEDFKIAKYPVTQAQYQVFIEAEDGYKNPAWWNGDVPRRSYSKSGRQIPAYANHPAVNVDWMEAMAYCRWLSHQLGYTVRLPTEWEWQQAACGGNPANVYPWGSDFDPRRANSYESGLSRTVAVGLYAQGASDGQPMDMAGNVWEWCLNAYEKPMPLADIVWTNHALRTLRGGSWLDGAGGVRCAYRLRDRPNNRNLNVGFRLLCGVLPGAF